MGGGIWPKIEFDPPLKWGTGEYILPFMCVEFNWKQILYFNQFTDFRLQLS